MKTFNIIAAGMGGQGIVLVSNIVGEACALSGKKAISGEMHGLAQRSGSVFIHQRIGEKLYSPLIPYGEADVVLALEISEALRYLFYAKPGGTLIANKRLIHPPGESQQLVAKKLNKYVTKDEIVARIKESGARLIEIDALGLANQAGNALTENVVMIGALAALDGFPLDKETMLAAVKSMVPPKAIEVNIKAFESGYKACCQR